jgi:serine/tyrosine/threonine adenylyltransferase
MSTDINLVTPPDEALANLQFENRFIRDLPGDSELRNFLRPVRRACYSRVSPTPVSNPRLVAYSREVAELLDLHTDPLTTNEFAEVFAGNRLLPGMEPFAMCYGGHQFGSWAGQLGDGRAINLGEVRNARGEYWMLQLKGAGPTPYSRSADGLAVLRSSVREFLCSEAMHHLGVPTTRALTLVTTGEKVVRDMFYDGNPRSEPGAVVCRVAPSFTRFGNFEIFAARSEPDVLRQLIEGTIRHSFPHLVPSDNDTISKDVIAGWFTEVCERTCRLMVEWMRVGFVHGVMNTDNMSILGLTIDYGPYGWLENYDPNWTPNTTDAYGRRYRFSQQPQIALWNLVQLANALVPVLQETALLEGPLNAYSDLYKEQYRRMMCRKLGLTERETTSDDRLIEELIQLLQVVETDMTIFFRQLGWVKFDASQASSPTQDEMQQLLEPLRAAYYNPSDLTGPVLSKLSDWMQHYRERVQQEGLRDATRRERMHRVNPKYVLRNYLAQLAIDKAEQGDPQLVRELLDVLRQPYAEQPDKEQFAEKRPDWARTRAGCSMLSCSS